MYKRLNCRIFIYKVKPNFVVGLVRETIILILPQNYNDHYSKYGLTARDHRSSLHKFQPKMEVVRYTQSTCKILHSVFENVRVFSCVFLSVFFYTRVSRMYFLCNLRAIWQIYTQEARV